MVVGDVLSGSTNGEKMEEEKRKTEEGEKTRGKGWRWEMTVDRERAGHYKKIFRRIDRTVRDERAAGGAKSRLGEPKQNGGGVSRESCMQEPLKLQKSGHASWDLH